MDSNDRVEPRDDADQAGQDDRATAVDPASTTIVGANITGLNTVPFPGGVAAPAAEHAASQAADEDISEMNLDALEQFGSTRRQTGDEGVSVEQRELEAGELNG